MTLAEQQLHNRKYEMALIPFSLCCFSCNTLIPKGTLVRKYDAATMVHETCPNTPHRTFAPHKYGDAK